MSYYKKGDLVKVTRTGRFALVNRDGYTKRYMDAQDHEMAAHGMGHLAGTYEAAVDVTFTDNGEQKILRISQTRVERVSSSAEVA
jgi:hypothetical protein